MRLTIVLALGIACAGCNNGDTVAAQQQNGTCAALGARALAAASILDLETRTPQVLIESRILLVDENNLDDFGVDLDQASGIGTDDGLGFRGGTSGSNQPWVVDSAATGGGPDAQYLVAPNQPADALLSIANINFQSPYPDGILVTTMLPFFGDCIDFLPGTFIAPNGLPNITIQNPPPRDHGYGGGVVHWGYVDDIQTVLAAVTSDTRNSVLTAPQIVCLDRQPATVLVGDVVPDLAQLLSQFQQSIQANVQNPLQIKTGVTFDVVPVVQPDGLIRLEVRPSLLASYFLSTPFNVGPVSADAELFALERSRNYTNVLVHDGQTVLLGGLTMNGQRERGLPFLGDVPLIGNLFTRMKVEERHELLILVTATILDPGEAE